MSRDVVTDALIVKDGKVLMIKRVQDPFSGYWSLIGGYVDWNEIVEQSVVREVKEEIGVKAKIKKFLGFYSDPTRDEKQNVLLVFELILLSENFKLQKEEVSEARWFDLDSLPENIAFNHRKIIEDYKKTKDK